MCKQFRQSAIAACATQTLRAAYEEARRKYLWHQGRESVGTGGIHYESVLFWDDGSRGVIEFEEFSSDGAICAALQVPYGVYAFGDAGQVIIATAGLAPPGWGDAVCSALNRERAWERKRRSQLLVVRGSGLAFHVSSSANRRSILAHGLDWRHMGQEAGVAGSRTPELPANFLCTTRADAEFFLQMARGPADLWAVDVTGLWLEGDPGADGGAGANWLLVAESVAPERLRLIET